MKEKLLQAELTASISTYLGKFRNGGDIVLGIPDALDIDGLGIGINGLRKVLGLVRKHELNADAELLEEDCGWMSEQENHETANPESVTPLN